MHEFFQPAPQCTGVKGLVLLGEKTISVRRDNNAPDAKGLLDLLGGRAEPTDASPFETFRREVFEEAGVHISENDIIYTKSYPGIKQPDTHTYFAVARLADNAGASMQLGNEGSELLLLTPEEFVARTDAWDIFQQRTADYLETTRNPS